MIILETLLLFLGIMELIIFADVILSYVSLFAGKRIRPRFISELLDPLYKAISSVFPTRIAMIDLTPLIAIIIIELIGVAIQLIIQ